MNDTFKLTDLCLTYPPHLITLSAIFLCAMNENVDILLWLSNLTIDIRHVS